MYRLRCSVIGRPNGRSVRPVGRSVHTLRQSDRQSDEIKHPTVCPTGRTKRLHDTIVGPTMQSVRRSYRVNAQLGQDRSDTKIIGLGLGVAHCGQRAGLVLCCETRSCHTGRHNDLEGHNNFSSTI